MNERILRNKVLTFLLSLCMVCTVFAGMSGYANAADINTDGAAVTGGDTITADGSYTIAANATGTISIASGVKAVTLTGSGTGSTANAELTLNCAGAGTDLTINNVYIKNTTNINTINFTGKGNKLTLKGTNLLEQMTYVNSAGIHVGSADDLTIDGSGTLYQYKYSAGSGIGGNAGEQNGAITFESGNIFIKGSKTGALIGTDTGAAGDVYIKGGNLNLVAKAQGAAIGGSKQSNGGNVYVSGGNTTITCDFSGSAIGKGTSGTDGGTLHVTGGSLKTYVTANAASSWGLTAAGDSDACITAAKKDGTTNDVYKYKLDTTDLTANSSGDYVVKVDGTKYYSGGLHGYDYSANDEATMSNWTASADKNLYLYLTGADHTVTVNGKTTLNLTWDSSSKTFTTADATYDTSWYNTTDTSFKISTKAQLAGLAAIVNGTAKDAGGNAIAQDTFAGKTVTLARDIALDSSNDKYTKENGKFGASSYPMQADYYSVNDDADIWTPIGSGVATANSSFTSRNYFSGTFDGAGYTVSGIYTDGSDTGSTVQGLFGCLGDGGVIKNVTTEGCITAKMVAGGVAAYVNGGTIENCTNKAIVYANGGEKAGTGLENGTSRAGAVGGIAGNAASGTNNAVISGCTNKGIVTCTNTSKGGRAGGILGLVDASGIKGSVTGCSNSAPVDAYQYSGGIVGADYSSVFTIEKSFNTAKVKVHSPGSAYAGGIVANSSGKITSCYNRGDVTIEFNGPTGKAAHAGGIGDALAGGVENCYNTGSITMSGTATSWSSMEPICVSGKAVNCYYLDTTKTSTTVNGTAKTSSEMKGTEFVADINGSDNAYYADMNNANDGYPVFSGQVTPSADSLARAKILFEGKTDAEITAKALQLDEQNISETVKKVEAAIADIGTVSKDSGDAITKAKSVYKDAVASDGYGSYIKSLLAAGGSADTLAAAEDAYAALNLSNASVKFNGGSDIVYNGTAQRPSVEVTDSQGRKIAADQYTVIYDSSNVNAGECSAIVMAKSGGDYYGSLTASFEIAKAELPANAIGAIFDQTYAGSASTPSLAVTAAGNILKAGTDYEAVYSSNARTGKATVTITAKGNYTGTAVKTFNIVPSQAKISKLKKGKKKVTVTIGNQSAQGVTGYQITYRKAGKAWKSVNTTSTKKVIKKLTKKKTYQVKVRAYTVIDGTNHYGAYSKVKKVRTK